MSFLTKSPIGAYEVLKAFPAPGVGNSLWTRLWKRTPGYAMGRADEVHSRYELKLVEARALALEEVRQRLSVASSADLCRMELDGTLARWRNLMLTEVRPQLLATPSQTPQADSTVRSSPHSVGEPLPAPAGSSERAQP